LRDLDQSVGRLRRCFIDGDQVVGRLSRQCKSGRLVKCLRQCDFAARAIAGRRHHNGHFLGGGHRRQLDWHAPVKSYLSSLLHGRMQSGILAGLGRRLHHQCDPRGTSLIDRREPKSAQSWLHTAITRLNFGKCGRLSRATANLHQYLPRQALSSGGRWFNLNTNVF